MSKLLVEAKAEREDIGVAWDLVQGDGTVRSALELWSALFGPAIYNTWQSTYFLLCRYGFTDNEAVPGESPADRQVRIRVMSEEIQKNLHGSDYAMRGVQAEEEGKGKPGAEIRKSASGTK